MTSIVLKRPTGVYLLAILFLFAPFGNILISFAGSGVQNWYDLDVMTPLLHTIPALDWVWLGLLFITGILLFFPHKLSWSIAIVTLFLVLGVNTYRLLTEDSNSINPNFLKVFSALGIICTFSILIIALYFRFPYLDRRAKWFGKEERFDIKTEVKVNNAKAFTESISISGCRLVFEDSPQFVKMSNVSLKFNEISAVEIEATVVEVLDKSIRVEFKATDDEFRLNLSRWLKGRMS